jgi:hypothetical protein
MLVVADYRDAQASWESSLAAATVQAAQATHIAAELPFCVQVEHRSSQPAEGLRQGNLQHVQQGAEPQHVEP